MTDIRTTKAGLLASLLAVQAETPTLPKDKTATVPTKSGGQYTYRYTDLATVVEIVGPLLNKHGLVWSTFPTHHEGTPILRYTLTHVESDESIDGEMPLLLGGKVDSQGLGSALTYARRYALCAVLNLVSDDDDDGARAVAGTRDARTTGADPGAVLSGRPTGPQLKYLKTLVTKSGAPQRTLRAMLDQVGASNIQIETGWAGRLSRDQASALIELFKMGVLPDPEAQDIPVDEIAQPSDVGDDSDLPFGGES